MAAIASSSSSSTLTKSAEITTDARPSLPIDRVRLQDGTVIAINDHIYVSSSLAPGAGEPYIIVRVMEFVSDPSKKRNASAASSSDNRQVRVNIYSRQRDVSQRAISDPRQLVATMLTDVYPLRNIRGKCTVRHRDLIGDGSAVSAWKKLDDHFYFHQLNDTYIRRIYDVILSDRVRNAPSEVLDVLRQRYSFVLAEPGLAVDLCGPLRACATCEQWASSTASVRCDTCRQFFHMSCLSPPLLSKPAKGYSWNCAPCSKKREQVDALPMTRAAALDASVAISRSSSGEDREAKSSNGPSRGGNGNGISGRGRGGSGRGRGKPLGRGQAALNHLDLSREVTPSINSGHRTTDDEKGTRCFNRWPFRYFGEHTYAYDVLDPDDSIYPRATPKIGPRFQTPVISWEEQKEIGLGVQSNLTDLAEVDEDAPKYKRVTKTLKGKRGTTDSGANTPISTGMNGAGKLIAGSVDLQEDSSRAVTPEKEAIRGGDDSIEVIWKPGTLATKKHAVYMNLAKEQFNDATEVGFYKCALSAVYQLKGDTATALRDLTGIQDVDWEAYHWTSEETKKFEDAMKDTDELDMRVLKTAIPSKSPALIVRKYYEWQKNQLGKQWAELKAKQNGKSGMQQSSASNAGTLTRSVSPALSLYSEQDEIGSSAPAVPPLKVCKMCATSQSSKWYRGPYSWHNRRLCSSCGMHWRKYATDVPLDNIMTRKREAQEEAALTAATAPPNKVAKTSKNDSVKQSATKAAGKASAPAAVAAPPVVVSVEPPSECILCKRKDGKFYQCAQCSLSVHAECFGINEAAIEEKWHCEACLNERTLDAALLPSCVLCAESHKKLVTSATSTNGEKVQLDALDAYKPTECNNWSHLLCTLFIDEITYTNPMEFKTVEGASNLLPWRYEKVCDLCKQNEGACVSCAEPSCNRTFHVSCAHRKGGFKFGIDITPVKGSRKDAIAAATFRGRTGHMNAVIFCNNHLDIAKSRDLIRMFKGDKVQSEQQSGLNQEKVRIVAAQVYSQSHKMAISAGATGDARDHLLLRRAKRMDGVMAKWSSGEHVLPATSKSRASVRSSIRGSVRPSDSDRNDGENLQKVAGPGQTQNQQTTCLRCTTRFSPYWWALPEDAQESSDEGGADGWLREYRKGKGREQASSQPCVCVRCRFSILPPLVV